MIGIYLLWLFVICLGQSKPLCQQVEYLVSTALSMVFTVILQMEDHAFLSLYKVTNPIHKLSHALITFYNIKN